MGASYGAVTVVTKNATPIREQMRLLGRACAIASSGDHVVVADTKIDEQYSDWLRELTVKLSAAVSAPAIGAIVHDDDVLLLSVAMSGQERTIYSSTDVMEDFLDEVEPGAADLNAFKDAFGLNDDACAKLKSILTSSGVGPESPYAFESDRHRDLCAALRLPEWVVFFSYAGLKDYPPDGFQNEFLLHYGA